MSRRGRLWLVELEGGHRLAAYRDIAGVWTIGAGLTRYSSGVRVKEGDHFASVGQAQRAFDDYLLRFELDVDAMTRDDLLQHEFDALVSFCWNLGPDNLRRSTLLRRVNEKAPAPAIADQFAAWHFADGHSVPGLITRRLREIEVYEGGEYRDQGGRPIDVQGGS